MLDVGPHIFAGRALPTPLTYREFVAALVAAHIITPDLGGVAGMRDLLVHVYLRIDSHQVWEAVYQNFGALQEVHAAFVALPELG